MKYLIISVLFLTLGCSKNPLEDQNPIELARIALNEQRYDDAIEILEDVDDGYEKTDILSSAYVGRAGFSAVNLFKVFQSTNDPQKILYELSKKYNSSNIQDSQKALDIIYELNKNPDYRPDDLNLKYSSIQLYKISQIINKNIENFKNLSSQKEIVDPCLESIFVAIDLKEIIISLTKAIVSVKNIQKEFYENLNKIQKNYNITLTSEEESVTDTDINSLKKSIGEDYREYTGDKNSCNSNSLVKL